MIAFAQSEGAEQQSATWQNDFLALLPRIVRHVRFAFRDLGAEAKEEAIHEAIANAVVAYRRLVEQGRANEAFPSPLARFAVAQVRGQRKVGGRLNIRDVGAAYCQRAKGLQVDRLDRYDAEKDSWREVVVEDRRARPDVVAAMRIDFAEWLRTLSRRMRRIALTLADGEETKAAAKLFGVSAGRISQIRRELRDSWASFQGEPLAA